MFDLNQEIAAWKAKFARQQTCSRDELDELESHLRDDIEMRVAHGESEAAAFSQAVARLGQPGDVCSEFAKNERLLWMDTLAFAVQRLLLAVVGLGAVALAVVAIRRGDTLLGAHVASITFGYAVAVLSCLIGVYSIARSLVVVEQDHEFRDRLASQCRTLLALSGGATAVGFVLGAFWARGQWGHYALGDPKAIGAIIVFGIAASLYRLVKLRQVSTRRLGQIAVAMSCVTLAAWFGPAMLS